MIISNLFPDSVKFIEYFASAVIELSSNLCVGSSPETKIIFFLLSLCTEWFIHINFGEILWFAVIVDLIFSFEYNLKLVEILRNFVICH